jgi:hypothetical protein
VVEVALMFSDAMTFEQRAGALVRVLEIGALLHEDRDRLLDGLRSGALHPFTRPITGNRFEVGLHAPGEPVTVLARVTRASVAPATPEAN